MCEGFPIRHFLEVAGVDRIVIIAGRTGYSYLCRGTQKRINNIAGSKYLFILKSRAGIYLKTIAVFLYTTEFTVKTLFLSFTTILISSHC
jgi:hypothetical protein